MRLYRITIKHAGWGNVNAHERRQVIAYVQSLGLIMRLPEGTAFRSRVCLDVYDI